MDPSRVTIFCFAASYAVALAMEALALVGRIGGRWSGALSGGRRATLLGFAAAGLFAHVAYLVWRAAGQVTPLSSPADWCLLAAAVLATAYVTLAFRGRRWATGLFLLPVVLALIAFGQLASDLPFSAQRASLFWGQTHGWLLLGGATAVCVGFVSGLMYLVQSWRLKHRLPPREGLTLPSLEGLHRVSAWALAASLWLVAGGFASGLVLAKIGDAGGQIWLDPLVVTSGAMLAWLLISEAFRWAYPPARIGGKVAYLTVAAFGLLVITLVSVATNGAGHGSAAEPTAAIPSAADPAPGPS